MTAGKLGSTKSDCKGMQLTCRAGTGAQQHVHTCWEDASDSHPSVAWPRRHKRSIAHLFMRHPEVVSWRR